MTDKKDSMKFLKKYRYTTYNILRLFILTIILLVFLEKIEMNTILAVIIISISMFIIISSIYRMITFKD
ncbi:hypothetical protein GOQ29_00755 [Clostridium sp. D2Q-14]|uniref:hypothetical protein n=1 Tax=Anaeromonas gelatinilytica TaxID=2683194 RepID=UPI00193B8561|nr:hypothetical protein [Anaeromonas gelatinilytica]MBS4534141.1 hypothetical protein [Anaeromonas gelatinilytica]